MIAGAFYPSGFIQAPANYAPTFRPHLHIMAHHGYSHIVSIAPYLAQIEMDKQLIVHWKHLEVCQLIVNFVQTKFEMPNGMFRIYEEKTKLSVLQNH